MARLAWASGALALVLSCGGSDYAPLFEGGGGINGGSTTGSGGPVGAGGSSSTAGSSSVGAGGSTMSGAGGATGSGGMTGSGGTTGSGGMTGGGGNANAGGAAGSSGGSAGSNAKPDSGAAGAGGSVIVPDAGPIGCTSNDSCPDTSYCRKATCNAERGVCTPKPKTCRDDAEETEVCGCNGVTYFSSCLAEWSGENVSLHGICADGVAVKCSNSNPACVNFLNGYCGSLATAAGGCPNGIGVPPVSRCWVLPDSCPTYANRFTGCNGSNKCSGTCDAVKDERPYYRQLGCN